MGGGSDSGSLDEVKKMDRTRALQTQAEAWKRIQKRKVQLAGKGLRGVVFDLICFGVENLPLLQLLKHFRWIEKSLKVRGCICSGSVEGVPCEAWVTPDLLRNITGKD